MIIERGANGQNVIELVNCDLRLVEALRALYLDGNLSLNRLRKSLDEHQITLTEYTQIVKKEA